MKPNIYILPGWGHRITDENYRNLIAIISKKYTYIPLRLFTRNRKYSLGGPAPLSEIIHGIINQVSSSAMPRDTIMGFSIGALEAYLAARRVRFTHVLLCSLPPVLGEDLNWYKKKELSDFSAIQLREMKKLDYAPLLAKKVTLLYGSKEHPVLKGRAEKLGRRKGWRAIEIPEAEHDMDAVYLAGVKKVL